MQRPTSNHDPHNGRLMLGVAGLLFIPLAGAGAWTLFFVLPLPQGPFEWGVRVFLQEVALTATLFFGVGFLWAVTGSLLLKKLLDTVAVKFAWLIIPLAIPVFAAVSYTLIFE